MSMQETLFTDEALQKRHHPSKTWKYLARHGKKPDKTQPEEFISVEDSKDSVPHLALMSKLQNCSLISEQIDTFISELSLTPEDLEKRTTSCKELEEIITNYLPGIKIYQFGSSVNGLGFKGCDLDVCIVRNDKSETEQDYAQLQDVPSLDDVKNQVVPLECVLCMPPVKILEFIKKIIRRHLPEHTKVLFIKGRCPVIRFYWHKYDLYCDFSAGNTSLQNTMLLLLLGHLDKRFPVLTKIIRYWGKYGDFVSDVHRFSCYALSLLVVHFLQTRNPPILPSVHEVTLKSEYLQKMSLENTDLMFEDVKKFPPSRNTKTVEELIREFFFHYLTYDYSRIMQPSVSSSIPVADFVPDNDSKEKFVANTVNILDPFRANFNLTFSVSYKSCSRFYNSLYLACEAFQNNCFTPTTETWGLQLLFETISHIKLQKPLKDTSVHTMIIPEMPNVAEKVKQILQHALLFNCSPMLIDPEHCSDSKVFMKLQCKVYHDTWTGRDWLLEKFEVNHNQLPLETEHLISKKLISHSKSSSQILSEFICVIKDKNEGKLTVQLNFLHSHAILAMFLKEYIPSLITNL